MSRKRRWYVTSIGHDRTFIIGPKINLEVGFDHMYGGLTPRQAIAEAKRVARLLDKLDVPAKPTLTTPTGGP